MIVLNALSATNMKSEKKLFPARGILVDEVPAEGVAGTLFTPVIEARRLARIEAGY
jgi:hypothetical protein